MISADLLAAGVPHICQEPVDAPVDLFEEFPQAVGALAGVRAAVAVRRLAVILSDPISAAASSSDSRATRIPFGVRFSARRQIQL